jgi:hypothetical protein
MFFSVYVWWLKRIFASELSWAAADGDLDESLCCRAADAGIATGDHSGLSISSDHVTHPSLDLCR